MILRAAKALALSGALIFSTGLIAQQNGQYNDPNYNNNQNGQYNNGQSDRDHDRDRDRDRDQYNQGPYDSNGYNNYGYNQNGEYNRQYDRQNASQYTQPPYENNGYNNYGYNQNGQYDRQYDRQYGRRYASNGNGRYGDTISSGTQIKVRTDQDINLKADDDNNGRGVTAGQVFPATIAEDVMDANGQVAIPRGARAQLRAVSTGSNGDLTLDLDSIDVGGRNIRVWGEDTAGSGSSANGGIGMNKRTGEYVGGGALAGTLLGAMIGGGKGAAIGAVLGGACGAGAQVLTHGHQLNVPAETVLTFRLNNNLSVPYNNGNNYNGRDRLNR